LNLFVVSGDFFGWFHIRYLFPTTVALAKCTIARLPILAQKIARVMILIVYRDGFLEDDFKERLILWLSLGMTL